MHPYLFGKISSYTVMLAVAIVAALLLFRVLTGKKGISDRTYNHYMTVGLGSILAGIISAFLFQAAYDFIETGKFELNGMTFMGGLVGGVICFIVCTLLCKDKKIKSEFWEVAEIAAPCISLAHGLGRIGCFLAGCCYGKQSEHGIYMPEVGARVIPTQLIEAIFLFVLTAALLVMLMKKRLNGYCLVTYALSYSIFRFVLEFFRDDPRGALLPFISPSQALCILLFIAGAVLLVRRLKFRKSSNS